MPRYQGVTLTPDSRFARRALAAAVLLLCLLTGPGAWANVVLGGASGAGPAFLTTFTMQNDSGSTIPAGTPVSFGQAFRYGDVLPGTFPVIRNAGTHVALPGQQWDEISTWRENGGNGSWRHAVWSAWLPTSIAAGGTFQVEFIVTSGTYSQTSHQAIAALCSGVGAHNLKIHLTDIRNQDDTVRDSGDATFRVCDNTANTGRDAPRHLRSGNVVDEYEVSGLFTYATSGNRDPLLYAQCILDIFTKASDGTSPGDTRWVCHLHNSWINVKAGSTGNAGNPGPAGFANDPQAVSYRAEIDDGASDVLDWSGLDATLSSSNNPVMAANGSNCDNFYSTNCMNVPSSTGNNTWYYGQPVRVSCSATCMAGTTSGRLYYVYPSGSTVSGGVNGQNVSLGLQPWAPGTFNFMTSSQGTGTTTFSQRIMHYQWGAWQTLDATGQDNWSTAGTTSRVTKKIYPAFTVSEKTYWEQTGMVIPMNLTQPAVGAGSLISWSEGLGTNYNPFAKMLVIGGTGVGGRPDLGIINQYAAEAWLTGTQSDVDNARLFTLGSSGHGQSTLLDEATGRIPVLNNGPPTGPGGSGAGGSYAGLGAPSNQLAWSPNLSNTFPAQGTPGLPPTGQNPGGGVFAGGTYLSHMPSFDGNTYAVFGDRYLLDLMQWNGNRDFLQQRPGPGPLQGQGYYRDNLASVSGNSTHFWGLLIACCEARGSAWMTRDVTYPGAFGGDANPERQYFADFLTENANYYPNFLSFKDGLGNNNYSTGLQPPDAGDDAEGGAGSFILSYLASVGYIMTTFQHSPFGAMWESQFALLNEAILGQQATNPPNGFYSVDYYSSYATHDGKQNQGGYGGTAVGQWMLGNQDAADFGGLNGTVTVGSGGQLNGNIYNMSQGGTGKTMCGWAGGAPCWDQLDGTTWYNAIGPFSPDGKSFYLQCPAGHAVTSTCPTPGSAFTDYTINGVSQVGQTDGEGTKWRPNYDGGAGAGFTNNNYTHNWGQMLYGLEILGYQMPHAVTNWNVRAGNNFFASNVPTDWLDTTIVIPGLPAVTNPSFGPVTPTITSLNTSAATVGNASFYRITAKGNPVSYNATGLPAGLSVNTGSGFISGTPTGAGTTNATISATNSAGTATSPLTITVSAQGGLLHATNSSRYMETANGKGVYLTGNHTWTSQNAWTTFGTMSFNNMIDYMKSIDVNFVRHWDMWSTVESFTFGAVTSGAQLPPLQFNRSGTCCAHDGGNKFDLTSFNPTYFTTLKSDVDYAKSKGMYIMPLLFFTFQGNNDWLGSPWNGSNNINGTSTDVVAVSTGTDATSWTLEKAYLHKFLDTLGAEPNVLYEVANELTASGGANFYNMVASEVHSYEAAQGYLAHPVEAEYAPGDETGGTADFISWYDSANPKVYSAGKPSFTDTDHFFGAGGGTLWWWKEFMGGNNPLSMDDLVGVSAGICCTLDLTAAGFNSTLVAQMRQNRPAVTQTRALAKMVDMTNMQPHGELSSTGYALADPALSLYIVFAPVGGAITFNLTSSYNLPLDAKWLNTADGTFSAVSNLTGGTLSQGFISPFGSNPAALIITPTAVYQPPTINSVALSPSTFVAQAGNHGTTVGTLSANVSGGSLTAPTPYSLATSGACTGTDNGSFAISGANLSLGSSDVTTVKTYSVCVRVTDAAFGNSPFFQAITVTGAPIPSGSPQGIALVGFSAGTFIGGSGSAGKTVGKLAAIMNPVLPAAACTWSIADGNASSFSVDSATGVVKVGPSDVAAGSYQWNATCTQAGEVMSPFVQGVNLTAVAPSTPTIEMIGGPVFNTGDTISFQVTNGPAGGYYVFLGETHGHSDSSDPGHFLFNDGKWFATLLKLVPAGNSNAVVSFIVPDQKQGPDNAYLQHYIAVLSADGNYSGSLAQTSWFDVPPVFDRQPPTTSSPGFADPFTPQHVVTVCPSGCDYSALRTAVQAVPDFTEIKIKAIQHGFYQDCAQIFGPNHGGPGGGTGGPNITHIWIKGVSNDGDFVHIQAPPNYGGGVCASPGSSGSHGIIEVGYDTMDATFENLEVSDCDGESNEGCFYLDGNNLNSTIRFRNVYPHDGENLISFAGENEGLTLTIENSHFVRGGHNYGGFQHNLYLGGCDPTVGPPCTVDFHNSVSEQTLKGHELKTRETTSLVTCSLFKEAYNPLHQGSAPIDFSEGRESVLRNSVIAMGPAADSNTNDFIRYGDDQEYPGTSVRYWSLQGNLFINDVGPDIGYADYGPRPFQTTNWANPGTVPPGNSTNNKWIGPTGFAGSPPVYQELPTNTTQPPYNPAPLRQNNTFYQGQDVITVPSNPNYLFANIQNGTTASSEPSGYACPGACPVVHSVDESVRNSVIVDGSAQFAPILPGVPLPATGDTFFATRTAAGLGPNDFPMPAACTAPVGSVAVPAN